MLIIVRAQCASAVCVSAGESEERERKKESEGDESVYIVTYNLMPASPVTNIESYSASHPVSKSTDGF